MTSVLITTCFREADAIDAFLDAVLSQTRAPDRIVILDAGSDDGTLERIQARIDHGAPITLLVEPGANRSVGRNQAIRAAQADLIAVTDVGAIPRPDWFERIIAPLERDETVDVVSGFYRPDARTTWEDAVASATVPTEREIDPETFLPSSRSVAFRRSVWEAAGGYPEDLWHNEDTPFDLAMKQAGARFVFEPAAVVEWRPQTSLRRLYTQFNRYARGDAQSGLWFGHYTKVCVLLAVKWSILIGGIFWMPLWWGLLGLLIAYWGRHALKAARRTRSPWAALLAPAANWIVDVAHLFGYARGLLDRRRHELGDR